VPVLLGKYRSPLERRHCWARAGPNRLRGRGSGSECHRVTGVRLRGSQARRHVFIHADEFLLRLPQARVLVLRQQKELGDEPRPVNCRHQVHELDTVDGATERPVPRCVHGLRHGHLGELERRVRNLHDQGVASDTASERLAQPEGNPPRVASTFAFRFALAVANFIAVTRHDRRHAFAKCIARSSAARRHRRKWTRCVCPHRPHRRDPGLAVDRTARFPGSPDCGRLAVQKLAGGCV
jgi:hypothetical protein